ncbi:dihydrodipicolinate synthase family protein [Cereibacter sphaeroides f. sp. denitrificans]
MDEKLFRSHTRFILDKKVHGVCLGGSTGEGFTLDPQELRRLTEITLDEVNGSVPVVAGIIANSTREVIQRATALKGLEVAALQVTPTFYVFDYGEEAMFQYFKRIWEETGVPLVIYNVIPWNLLSADLVIRLLEEIPGIIGIKQSQGNISRAAELVIRAPKGKAILAAIDDLLYPCFMMGAQGTLAASPTAAPGPCVRLWDAVQAGDHALAPSRAGEILPRDPGLPGGPPAAPSDAGSVRGAEGEDPARAGGPARVRQLTTGRPAGCQRLRWPSFLGGER